MQSCSVNASDFLDRLNVREPLARQESLGVDLSFEKPRRIELQRLPGSWALLRDLLRPRRQRRYRLPSLTNYLINVTPCTAPRASASLAS